MASQSCSLAANSQGLGVLVGSGVLAGLGVCSGLGVWLGLGICIGVVGIDPSSMSPTTSTGVSLLMVVLLLSASAKCIPPTNMIISITKANVPYIDLPKRFMWPQVAQE